MSNVPRKQGSNTNVEFTHQSVFNEIVGTSHVCLSHYFMAHWLSKITPNGLKILLQLRSMGYYNPKTEVKRGDIDIEQPELARLIGISVKTIQRVFAEDKVLAKYVQRVFQIKRDKFGRIVKEHYVYVVTMDDVLTLEDMARYQVMLHGPDKQSGSDNPPNGQSVASDGTPTRQSDASVGQNAQPSGQNDAQERQNVASYNESLTHDTLNTPNTAALPRVSASLFEEQDHSEGKPLSPLEQAKLADKAWTGLLEDARSPWLEQAERELIAIHTGTGITPRPQLIAARAKNLYKMSLHTKN